MISQCCITAGVDLRLGHSCPREPYCAAVFAFLVEADKLSVPPGVRLNGQDHVIPDQPCGIWGMVLSLRHAQPFMGGDVFELCLFVGTPS